MKIDLISWSQVKFSNQSSKKSEIKGNKEIDYKDVALLRGFLYESGRIIPAKYTCLSAKKQRELTLAIKRARFMGLLPYLNVGEFSWK